MITEKLWNVLFTITKIFPTSLVKFNQNYQNCQIKFGIQANLDLKNLMVAPTFSILNQKYPFGKICLKKSELSVSGKGWYLQLLTEYLRLSYILA